MLGGTSMGATFLNGGNYMDSEVLEKIQLWINCDYQTIDACHICYGTITPKKEPPTLVSDSLKNKNYIIL